VEAKEAKEATSTGRAMSEEALRKRKAREQKKMLEKAKAAASSIEGSDTLFTPKSATSTTSAANPVSSASPATPSYTVTIPTSSSSLPWYVPHKSTYTTLAWARMSGVWMYPSTLHERAKCGVFRGLWEQGYFMGGGIKFGGDFLVYPGLYHSILAFQF
jgi:tRNA-splicing endonuclease subunit Sen34